MEREQISQDSDSRLKGYFGNVTHPTLKAERTYCFLCGKPWGYTTQESSQFAAPAHIVVTCDDCDERIFKIAGGDLSQFPLDQVPAWLFDAFGIIPEEVAKSEGA